MTKVRLLDELKKFIEEAVRDFSLPVSVQKDDDEDAAEFRAPEVHKMRLPDGKSYKKFAPYIIIQYVSGRDIQPNAKDAEGESSAFIRFIFCVYNENDEDGAMTLLNVMERVRIKLLEAVAIGGLFQLDAEKDGLESIIYNDDTAPYFGGEIVGTFYMQGIKKDWRSFLGKENY